MPGLSVRTCTSTNADTHRNVCSSNPPFPRTSLSKHISRAVGTHRRWSTNHARQSEHCPARNDP